MAKPAKYTFYRPHPRVQEKGELVNPKTGEVEIPPSMTKQEFARECDINNVIKAFKTHGMFTHVNAKAAQGAYQDLPDSVDFQESLHTIMVAEQAFMSLPAKVRDRFGQDPAQFLAFMQDPANLKEARELGLVHPEPTPPTPLEVRVVNPVPQGNGGQPGGNPPVGGASAP